MSSVFAKDFDKRETGASFPYVQPEYTIQPIAKATIYPLPAGILFS
jgi:hypothetical protein